MDAVVLALSLTVGLFVCVPGARARENRVRIDRSGGYRVITSNGIPDHEPGRFPNSGNPNAIREQRYVFRAPLEPAIQAEATPVPPHLFGVALNGVPFDPGTAEFWKHDPRSGWHYEALSGRINLGLEGSNAHVQPNGAYHYHGIPVGLLRRIGREGRMTLIGYAADGFPIYSPLGYRDALDPESGLKTLRSSYRLRDGERPGGAEGPGGVFDGKFVEDFHYVAGSGDLDACNGRYGMTPEYPEGTYYYVITNDFPFVPRFWRGAPHDSFRRRAPAEERPRPRPMFGDGDGRPAGAPPPRVRRRQDVPEK